MRGWAHARHHSRRSTPPAFPRKRERSPRSSRARDPRTRMPRPTRTRSARPSPRWRPASTWPPTDCWCSCGSSTQRLGWNTGFLSCAHWLHWRTGIDLGAAREKVRVARALAGLPRIAWAMEHGQLSYAKVRALTRVATPENEDALLDVALCGHRRARRAVRAWVAPGGPRVGGARGRAAAPDARAPDVGGRRRHGGAARTAHARGRRRRVARARGRRRPAVPGRAIEPHRQLAQRRGHAGAASGGCAGPAGRSRALRRPRPRHRRRSLSGGAARGRPDSRRVSRRRHPMPAARSNSTTAPSAFPRKRRDACRATPRWSRCDHDDAGLDERESAHSHDSRRHSSRAGRARPHLPLPRLHLAPMRRPSHRTLG